MTEFSHLDREGEARMVDVGEKAVVRRTATAAGRICMSPETVELLRAQGPVIRRHLITDVVPFAEAADVIVELAERKRHAIQLVIAFDGAGAR